MKSKISIFRDWLLVSILNLKDKACLVSSNVLQTSNPEMINHFSVILTQSPHLSPLISRRFLLPTSFLIFSSSLSRFLAPFLRSSSLFDPLTLRLLTFFFFLLLTHPLTLLNLLTLLCLQSQKLYPNTTQKDHCSCYKVGVSFSFAKRYEINTTESDKYNSQHSKYCSYSENRCNKD